MNIDIFGPVESKPDLPRRPHVLRVHPYDTDGDENPDFEIVHPSECQVEYHANGDYWQHDCGVAFEVDNSGLWEFFKVQFDWDDERHDPYRPTLIPGEYLIEDWVEKYTHWEYGPEWSSGIQLIYPEEAQ